MGSGVLTMTNLHKGPTFPALARWLWLAMWIVSGCASLQIVEKIQPGKECVKLVSINATAKSERRIKGKLASKARKLGGNVLEFDHR